MPQPVQGQAMHGDMDPGSMGLAEALDSQNLTQHLIKPYSSDHAHLHSIMNAQEHLSHSIQGVYPLLLPSTAVNYICYCIVSSNTYSILHLVTGFGECM